MLLLLGETSSLILFLALALTRGREDVAECADALGTDTASQETIRMVAQSEIAWVPGERDYKIGLCSGKLVCQNPKGQTLASLPKWLKESDAAESLLALAEWLDEHRSECLHTVERWMLLSLIHI